MENICDIKKISYDDISFWYSTLLTMLFYSSYSRKLINYLKIFEKNNNNDIFTILKSIFNKNDDTLNKFSSNLFHEIINNYHNFIIEKNKINDEKKKKDNEREKEKENQRKKGKEKGKGKEEEKEKGKEKEKEKEKEKGKEKNDIVMINNKKKIKVKYNNITYYISPNDNDNIEGKKSMFLLNNIYNFFSNPFKIVTDKIKKKAQDLISIKSQNLINKKKDDKESINRISENSIEKKIIDFIHKNGYTKSFFIHYVLNNLNLKYLIIDANTRTKEFYIGYSENINLIINKNNNINFNYDLIDYYITDIKKNLNTNIPEYIIVNIYNDTTTLNDINMKYTDLENKLNIKNFNIKIDGLEKFDKIIIYNNYKYILDSVSFDYYSNESMVGIHCNNKKFIYDKNFKFYNIKWNHVNGKRTPIITMLIYVLYEPKKINDLICYNSINKNLFFNHWINCFLIMFFKSYNSKNFFIKNKIFNKKTDELSLFLNNILTNNDININYKNEDIIKLFNVIKIDEYIINYIKKFGYPIHNFIPLIFKFYEIDFLMLDFHKNNFYIGINEFFAYYLESFNNNFYTKYVNNMNIKIYSKVLMQMFKRTDYIPKYIFINILNDKYNYIDNMSNDRKQTLNFNNYKIKIDGLKSFKDIIIFKGRKYKLDSFSLNNSNNNNTYDKINRINNSIIGIYCNDDKYIYNGIVQYSKKKECKLIKYDWNINKKSNFYIDNDNCSINNILKSNDTSFSFKTGFKILVYVLIDDIEDETYSNDYIYSSLSPYLKNKFSSFDILKHNEEKRIKDEKIQQEKEETIQNLKNKIQQEEENIKEKLKIIESLKNKFQEEKEKIQHQEEENIQKKEKIIESLKNKIQQEEENIQEKEKIIESLKNKFQEEKEKIQEEKEKIQQEKEKIQEEKEKIIESLKNKFEEKKEKIQEKEKIIENLKTKFEEEKEKIQQEKEEIIKTLKNKIQQEEKNKIEKKEKEVKKCPDDKILNPKTNRCVSKNSKIGKELSKKKI